MTDCASPRFVVRPYEPRDREAVREICCETADNGRPMDAWFPDREIFADLLMRYYTDCEPQSLWVAESNTEVVGYLAACQNTRLFRCCMAVWILPVTILKALTRGTLWHPKIRELLRANRAAFCHQPRAAIGAYPAHLHINLRAGFRGLRIGRSLLQHWLRAAHTARIRGVHVVVRADNTQARRFFEAMGFHLLGAGRSYRLPPDNRLVETCIYGLRLPQ
ncbi:MAG: GNAT family N-acetyltransferase [Verrucomicrobiae bacterium]|nr:GNAT family N-acetyltransferase [Verrucomicrobiae bacterium]